MKLKAEVIEKTKWDQMCESYLKDSFGTLVNEDYENYSFCILVKTEGDTPHTYAMVRELDSETAYLTFGGVTKDFRGQGDSYFAFTEIVSLLNKMYLRVGFSCRSNNTGMIKVGLNEGFEITGMQTVYGFPHLLFLLERGS